MIWPRKKVAPELEGAGTRSSTGVIVRRSLSVAYRNLQAIVADRAAQQLKQLVRAAL